MEWDDVSKWQGAPNWDKYPWKRVAIRVGYGNQGIDVQYARNWKETKARGIARQPYWFHVPGHDINKHLESFFRALGDDPGEVKPLWDAETIGNLTASASLNLIFPVAPNERDSGLYRLGGYYKSGMETKPSLIDRAQMYATGLKNKLYDELCKAKDGIKAEYGVYPEIYTNNGFWNAYVPYGDIERDCDLDIAHWDVQTPSIPVNWQKRGKGATDWQDRVIKGGGPALGMESQDIDHQLFMLGDVAAFNAWAGTSIPVPPPPSPDPTPETGIRLRVLTDWVYVRSEPRISATNMTGKLYKGDIITLQDLVTDRLGVWVRHNAGWSAAYYNGVQYMERVA